MPDDVRFKILNLFITTISNFGLNNSLKQKLLLKDGLFPAIGELLCKQEVNRTVVVSMLKLALSLDTSEQMKADIYTDFNIVLSVVRIAHYLPRPIKLEVAIKVDVLFDSSFFKLKLRSYGSDFNLLNVKY